MGRVLGGIRLVGVLLSASVLLHSFLSASKIISDGRNKDIPIDQLCDTVHVVVGSLQFQLTTKNEIGNPFWGNKIVIAFLLEYQFLFLINLVFPLLMVIVKPRFLFTLLYL